MSTPKIKLLFDRKHLASKTRKGIIDLRITIDKKQKFVSTGISVYPKEWNERREEVVNVKEAVELNTLLAGLKKRTYKIFADMEESGRVDINAIPTLLRTKKVDITFLDYIIDRSERKPVGDYAKKSYAAFYNKLHEYGKIVYFRDISEKAIRDFDEWLHAYTWTSKDKYGSDVKKNYSQATIGSFHKNMKAFIADAVVDGYLSENIYVNKRIKVEKGSTRIDQFLTKEEINAIESADMHTRSLTEARDLFLIQVFTGLSYVDLMAYDFTQCRDAEDYAVFSGIRSKTGTVFTFVLTPKAKAILEKYDFRLPKLLNQPYNMKIKLIADAAGIDKNVTSHDARRSCGYLLLNAGVPMAVVSRVLGHSSVRQTEKAYARLLDDTIAAEIKKYIK